MDTTTKIVLGGVGVGVAGGVAYLVLKKRSDRRKKSKSASITTDPIVEIPQPATNPYTTKPKSVSTGTGTERVRALQAALVRNGIPVAIDGRWGPKTNAALAEAQKRGLISTTNFATAEGQKEYDRFVSGERASASSENFSAADVAQLIYREIYESMFNTSELAIQRALSGKNNAFLKQVRDIYKKEYGKDLASDLKKLDDKLTNPIADRVATLGDAPVMLCAVRNGYAADKNMQRIAVKKGVTLGNFVLEHDGITKFRTIDKADLYIPTCNVKVKK